MANYNTIRYGASGDDVKKLQEALNGKGNYNLSVDGQFGSATEGAVRDYQQNSGLSVDGVVGDETWGSLMKTSESAGAFNASAATEPTFPAATTPQTETKPKAPTYAPYEPSDTVKQAEAMLQQQLSQKPGAYTSVWQTPLNDTIGKIMNREDFSYDLNGDALYQQYKDKYIQQGQMAMMDTMGQAADLTGGYGSSYAQNVGQQAYQAQLQDLNDVVPELYQMALDQYNQKGQDLYDQYSLLATQEDQDYGRYQDQLSHYYTELDRLTEDARYQGEQDYGRWADGRNFDYQLNQDEFSRQETAAQLMASMGDYSMLGKLYGLTDEQIAVLNGQMEDDAGTGSGGGGTGTGDTGNEYKTMSWDDKDYLRKLFSGATSTEELGQLASIYGDGYDPAEIDEIMRLAAPDLYYQELGEYEEEPAIRRAAKGRNDGTYIYATVR